MYQFVVALLFVIKEVKTFLLPKVCKQRVGLAPRILKNLQVSYRIEVGGTLVQGAYKTLYKSHYILVKKRSF